MDDKKADKLDKKIIWEHINYFSIKSNNNRPVLQHIIVLSLPGQKVYKVAPGYVNSFWVHESQYLNTTLIVYSLLCVGGWWN